jgi:hypothetical protein
MTTRGIKILNGIVQRGLRRWFLPAIHFKEIIKIGSYRVFGCFLAPLKNFLGSIQLVVKLARWKVNVGTENS